MAVTSKGNSWEFINSLWLILVFVPFLYWAGLLVAGIRANVKKWIFYGALYAVPFFSLFLVFPGNPSENVEGVWVFTFMVTWLIAIIHSFLIRPQYLRALADEPEIPSKKSTQKRNPAPDMTGEYAAFMRKVANIRNDILRQIESSKAYENDIVNEIKTSLENYLEQTRQLMERDQKLKMLLRNFNQAEIDTSVKKLEYRMTQTTNPELKREYQNSIERYNKHRHSLQDIRDQREVIRLRLNSSFMSLKQLKMDLIKMESLETHEQREHVFNTFEQKTTDLQSYLKYLKQSYDEFDL